jgi:large subunit ribosomal protein L19
MLNFCLFTDHGTRPRYRDNPKFKSPRKRASNLLHELQSHGITISKAAKPAVWETTFRVGDAIELTLGRNPDETEKIRGVVLGRYHKGLDESVLLRDVVFGQPVERRIKMHSPLLQSVTVLEENFVYKGKRKVKRAKLYFLRDRNPVGKCYSFVLVSFFWIHCLLTFLNFCFDLIF